MILSCFLHEVPASFNFPTAETVSVNGSSQDGSCSTTITAPSIFRLSKCLTPTSSVLFDGNIPTLTGLDGDMWASQLLTLQIHNEERRDIISDFTDTSNYTGVDRVELVMFNCPEWGVSVRDIQLLVAPTLDALLSVSMTFSPNITSCDSLVRVCISHVITEQVIAL